MLSSLKNIFKSSLISVVKRTELKLMLSLLVLKLRCFLFFYSQDRYFDLILLPVDCARV